MTTDCNAQGAICTGDDRKLSNRLAVTVYGPGSAIQNSPATGAPTIGGTAQAGQTLGVSTSGITDSDGLTNVSYSYQWLADDADIEDATGSTYKVSDDDVGKTIKVRVSFTDDASNQESLTSAATAAVTAKTNTPATGLPTITGTAQVDEALTASTSWITDADGIDSVSFSYQWIAGGSNIPGATGSSYTLTASRQGQTIQVKVSFTDAADNEETLTSEATAAVAAKPNSPATGQPTISGTAQVGETLTADTSAIADEDGLENASFSYQWIRNEGSTDTDVSGATGQTYILGADDKGKTVKVQVSLTDDEGNSETLTSASTAAVVASPNSPATGIPTIGGTAQVGQTLTADTSGIADNDGLDNVSYNYQWTAGGSDIPGATGSSYTLTASEQGQTIQVQVSFTDDGGNDESLTSAATDAVAAKPDPLTVTLENNPASHDGQAVFTFELRFSEHIADLSYRTLRDHALTVTGGQVKKAERMDPDSETRNIHWKITVGPDGNGDVTIVLPVTTDCGAQRAICTEDGRKLSNRLELTVSGPDSAIQNSPATGAPAITGTAQVGQTLAASTTGIADSDGLTGVSYSYQWLADGADIEDATGSSHTLTASQQGKTVKVRVTFTDDANNNESLTSAATGEVTAAVAGAALPLTVTLENDPASHDGSAGFTFELRFSEHIADLSYKTLRDHAFTVTGGQVKKAQRMDPDSETRNIHWRITVEPDTSGDVTIVLPVTTDCAAQGAICTGDGRKLSNRMEIMVPGPGG